MFVLFQPVHRPSIFSSKSVQRLARVIINKNRGRFTDLQRKGLGVGKEKILYFSFLRSALVLDRWPMFSKRTKRKIKQRLCKGQFCSAVSFCSNTNLSQILCWMSPLMKRKSILIVFVQKIPVRLVKTVCVVGNSSEKYFFLDL